MGRAVDTARCRECGAPVVFLRVIADEPKGPLKSAPFEPDYKPGLGTPPSHAAAGQSGTTCRPLRRGEHPAPDERPVLTHFATCPARATKD